MDQNLLKETKLELESIAEVLYKGDTNKGIAGMNEIIPRLAVISTNLTQEEQARFMNDVLSPVLQAMEDRDGTMLADVISYELIEFLDGIK